MKKFACLAVLVLLPAALSVAQERTVVSDRNAAKMILGRHKLSLQWISWDYFGVAAISERTSVMHIKGEQRGRGNSDLVTIDGIIVSVGKNQFVVEGTIITRISHINGGKPCERHGDFTFKVTGKRKYWRMQEMNNPCDDVTDYVDIYFR